MEITGKIKHIGAEQQVSASFKKRELVVTTDEQYPQSILTEFTQDKCEYLDNYQIGESVTVSINLRGREWVNPQGETRYFNSIQGWQIKRNAAPQAHHSNHQTNQAPTNQASPQPYKDEEPDDLPFN